MNGGAGGHGPSNGHAPHAAETKGFSGSDGNGLLDPVASESTAAATATTIATASSSISGSDSASLPAPPPPSLPRFQNPLAGWLASTLQCCRCGHRRPVHNAEFIDVALPLPDTAAVLGGGAVRLGLANGSARAAAGRPCHLTECLAEYAAEELLQGVECWGCVRHACLAALDGKVARLEG